MDNFNSMDTPTEQALDWIKGKLPEAEWAILIVGTGSHWERGVFGIQNVHEFYGVLEDVKMTEQTALDSED